MKPLDEVRQFLPQARPFVDPYVKEAFELQVGGECDIRLYKTAKGHWDCYVTISTGNIGHSTGGFPTALAAFNDAKDHLFKRAEKLVKAVALLKGLADTTKVVETKE